MAPTPYRNLIIGLRIVAGLLAGAAMGLYIVIYLAYSEHSWITPTWGSGGLTALPLGAASYSVFWNILALLLVKAVRPAWHAVFDFIDAVVVAVVGSIGFTYDYNTYLSNGIQWTFDNPWGYQEIIAAIALLLSILLQFALAVFNILEHRNAKKAGSRVPLPPYSESQASPHRGLAPLSNEKELDFELDAQSLRSSESYSSVKKPEPVVV